MNVLIGMRNGQRSLVEPKVGTMFAPLTNLRRGGPKLLMGGVVGSARNKFYGGPNLTSYAPRKGKGVAFLTKGCGLRDYSQCTM